MKKIVLSIALLLISTSPVFAAERSVACEAKQANIEAQISHAMSNGRSQEIIGLKKALAANKAHCTDASLAKERDEKIREAQRKVTSREESLAEAERKGDIKKIAIKKAKLEQARRDLVEAEKPIGQ